MAPQIDIVSDEIVVTDIGHLRIRVRTVKPATNNDFIVTDGSGSGDAVNSPRLGRREAVAFFAGGNGVIAVDAFYTAASSNKVNFTQGDNLYIQNAAGRRVAIVTLK